MQSYNTLHSILHGNSLIHRHQKTKKNCKITAIREASLLKGGQSTPGSLYYDEHVK